MYQPTSLCGVFSSSDVINPSSQGADRVPGAIGPISSQGAGCLTPGTHFGNVPTDISQDFSINEIPLTVPKGAAYLIVAIPDSFYADNVGSPSLTVWVGCGVSANIPPAPSIKQYALPWGTNTCRTTRTTTNCYDHTSRTIHAKGCALTALNMSLNFQGDTWNPGTLNDLFNQTPGVYGTTRGHLGDLNFLPGTVATNPPGATNPLVWDPYLRIDSDRNLVGATITVEQGICAVKPVRIST